MSFGWFEKYLNTLTSNQRLKKILITPEKRKKFENGWKEYCFNFKYCNRWSFFILIAGSSGNLFKCLQCQSIVWNAIPDWNFQSSKVIIIYSIYPYFLSRVPYHCREPDWEGFYYCKHYFPNTTCVEHASGGHIQCECSKFYN